MKIVNILFVRRNNAEFDHLQKLALNVEGTQAVITQWRVPVHQDGRHVGFKYVNSGAKPSVDSVKVIRLHDSINNEIFYAAIPDNLTVDAFSALVNAAAGQPVDMPAVTLPEIFVEEFPCLTGGVYTVNAYTQALVGAQVYVVTGTKNGAYLPAPAFAGYASLADFKTFADANWAASVTTTTAGTRLTIASADGKGMSLSVERRNYFESAADASLAASANYKLDATINGIALPTVSAPDNASLQVLADLVNANPDYARFGKYSVVANKIRLVAYSNVDTAVLTLAEVA